MGKYINREELMKVIDMSTPDVIERSEYKVFYGLSKEMLHGIIETFPCIDLLDNKEGWILWIFILICPMKKLIN